mmetsp:Transcript_10885/g.33106  ORF Transcript_10885/g.33106 Transcript_10885/m.33106 type:complete len:284 (+) Transcript_10885:213-1064(+)
MLPNIKASTQAIYGNAYPRAKAAPPTMARSTTDPGGLAASQATTAGSTAADATSKAQRKRARKKKGKKGAPGGAGKGSKAATQVFSTFTLNKDPECSKYMPYDEVAYPALRSKSRDGGAGGGLDPLDGDVHLQEGVAMAEMDSMWMVGFMDHTARGAMQHNKKVLQDFMHLPGGQLLPSAASDLQELSTVDTATASAQPPDYTPRLMDPDEESQYRLHKANNFQMRMSTREQARLKELGDELVLNIDNSTEATARRGRKAYKKINDKIGRIVKRRKKGTLTLP